MREYRCFKFQEEIQFSSKTIMKQLKHRDWDSFYGCNMSCFYQALHHITCMISLLMSGHSDHVIVRINIAHFSGVNPGQMAQGHLLVRK